MTTTWTGIILRTTGARAAYDNFAPLDGQFEPNVIIQIKNGPIHFQVREPVSPLFDALKLTNEALELQVTQEYMGQARHLVFLGPQWKEVFPKKPLKGVIGVTNVGLSANWLGNHMSQANLYAFGAAGLGSKPDFRANHWRMDSPNFRRHPGDFGNAAQVVAGL